MTIIDSTGNLERKRLLRTTPASQRRPPRGPLWQELQPAWLPIYDDEMRCSEAVLLVLDLSDLLTRIEHDERDPTDAYVLADLYGDLASVYDLDAELYAWTGGTLDHVYYHLRRTTNIKAMRRNYRDLVRTLRKALQQ